MTSDHLYTATHKESGAVEVLPNARTSLSRLLALSMHACRHTLSNVRTLKTNQYSVTLSRNSFKKGAAQPALP